MTEKPKLSVVAEWLGPPKGGSEWGEPKVLTMKDGGTVHYVASEPTFVGKFPLRTELTPIEPDPNFKPVTYQFYSGAEVGLLIDGKVDCTPLTKREDIWEGREVVAPTLVGYYKAVVHREGDGFCWKTASGGMGGDLTFDADDRHCWVTSHAINMRDVDRLAAMIP